MLSDYFIIYWVYKSKALIWKIFSSENGFRNFKFIVTYTTKVLKSKMAVIFGGKLLEEYSFLTFNSFILWKIMLLNWIEFILRPLGIWGSGRDRVGERMLKGRRPRPILYVPSQHLFSMTEEKNWKNLSQRNLKN